MLDLKGPIAPLLTPFNSNNDIDQDTFEIFIKWLIENKIAGLFPIGGSGEKETLSFNEKKKIIKIVNEVVDKKIPVIPGTGGDSLKETLELSEYAFNLGSDAVFIVIPKEIPPLEEKLFSYFKEIDKVLDKPFFIYEPPEFGPYSITPKLFKRLLELPNFMGMKDSSYDMVKITLNTMEIKERKICIIQGNEILYLSSLPLGINTVIGGGCNIYPKLFIELYNEYHRKNIDKAREIQWEIIRRWKILERGWPLSGKIFLSFKGIPFKPICRVPINNIDQESVKKLALEA